MSLKSVLSKLVPYPTGTLKLNSVYLHLQSDCCRISVNEGEVRPFNTLVPRQNRRHFAVDTFKRIFLNEIARSWIKMSPKFVPKRPTNNIPALVQ